jgi:carbon-monoxide dehydrogenase medium subunit
VVEKSYALLFDTAKVIADPLVRNKATVGGNLAHADPANDHPATMLAYNAQVIARSASGSRTIGIDDLFVGLFETSLKQGEILTEIRIPKPGPNAGGAYIKIERKVGDYAVAAVAVQLELAGPGSQTIKHIRIGLTNVSPVPMRAKAAEAALVGQPFGDAVLEAAAKAAANECAPSADLRGQVDYKRDMVRILIKRVVRRAFERAQSHAAPGGRP